jgi:putative DNA primase/helicase
MNNAEEIALALGGHPRREGNGWRARCPVHGGHSLILSNARDGTLLWNCKAGCGQDEVQRELFDLGLYHREVFRWRPMQPVSVESDSSKIEYARKLWRQSRSTTGTLAEDYLRARGYSGPLKKSLRFHPELWHKPSHKSWPALVAEVLHSDTGEFVGIHRTWLSGQEPKKAPLGDQTKMALGRIKGGVVPLGRLSDKLLLGEGIETTLCASQLAHCPAWALLGSWNYELVEIPDRVRTVLIAADHDHKDTAMHKARMLRVRLVRRGVVCHIAAPPDPGTDWADVTVGA